MNLSQQDEYVGYSLEYFQNFLNFKQWFVFKTFRTDKFYFCLELRVTCTFYLCSSAVSNMCHIFNLKRALKVELFSCLVQNSIGRVEAATLKYDCNMAEQSAIIYL